LVLAQEVHLGRSSLTSAAKAGNERSLVIAAVNRCATQKRNRTLPQGVRLEWNNVQKEKRSHQVRMASLLVRALFFRASRSACPRAIE
jgi:hypothetical protein